MGVFAPNNILPKIGFVRKILLINKHIPLITKLVAVDIINMIVGESIPLSLTQEIELVIKKITMAIMLIYI